VRRERWGNRIIDLDLLLWREAGQDVCTAHGGALATLPHPRMMERDFVLVPALEIAADWRAEVGGATLAEIARKNGWV
jgi:2-amino-4-hydroxy-6-hydroxymethyldihydropteridine diphosphokinase